MTFKTELKVQVTLSVGNSFLSGQWRGPWPHEQIMSSERLLSIGGSSDVFVILSAICYQGGTVSKWMKCV